MIFHTPFKPLAFLCAPLRVLDVLKTFLILMAVSAFAEALAEAATFEMIALPDTQYYSAIFPAIFNAQTQWIVDHKNAENIVFVSHLGDIVDNGTDFWQWNNALAAINILNGQVPYSLCFGNHDLYWDPTNAKAYFGDPLHQGGSTYGGNFNNLCFYQTFSVAGYDFLHINLNYQPSAAALNWAQGVINDNPGKTTILSTHSYLNDLGNRNNEGNFIWNGLVRNNPQIFLVLCGHEIGPGNDPGNARLVSVNDSGLNVLQALSDYQNYAQGDGYLRKIIFDTGGDRKGTISIQTYSPTDLQHPYRTSNDDQFSYPIILDPTFHLWLTKTWSGAPADQWNRSPATQAWQGDLPSFSDGAEVLFDGTAQVRTVLVTDTVQPSKMVVNNDVGQDYTIISSADGLSGKISGAMTLVKKGSGKLVLSGTNDFTGGTNLTAGTIMITGPASLGASSGILTMDAATLEVTASFASTRPLMLNNASSVLQIDSNVLFQQQVPLSGTGGLVKQGNGTLDLAAANVYAGPTVILGGALRLSHPQALPGGTGAGNLKISSGLVELAAGDFLRELGTGPQQVQFDQGDGGFAALGGDRVVNFGGASAPVAWDQAGFIKSSHCLILSSPAADALLDFQNPLLLGTSPASTRSVKVDKGSAPVDAKLSGVLSGASGLEKIGAGVLELSAANTYTGETILSDGILRLTNADALPGGTGTSGGISHLRFNGGVIELAVGDFYRGLGTGGHQVQFSGAGGFSAAGAYRAVNLGGSGTQVSWGNNSFVPNNFPLILGASGSDATVDFQNPIDLGAALRTVQVNRGIALVDAILSGALSGSGGLNKTGDGILMLDHSNTYGGGTTVTAGVLLLGSNYFLPSNGAITVNGGSATLDVGLTNQAASTVTLLDGAIVGTGMLSAESFDLRGGVIQVNLGGHANLIKNGPGIATLTNFNTYTGTTIICGGGLDAVDGVGLPMSSGLVLSGGVFQSQGVFYRSLTANPTPGTFEVTWSADGGSFAARGNNLDVSLDGNGATLTWDHDGFVKNGTPLIFGSATADQTVIWLNPIQLTADSDATREIRVDRGNGTAPEVQIPVALSEGAGIGALLKSGSGTLVLCADNTYTGGTMILNGTLQLGDGCASNGSVVGKIVNHAALAFANPYDQTSANVLSGSGALSKSGAGTLTLIGNNTYTGTTLISDGTLALADHGQIGASAMIVNNATFLIADGVAVHSVGNLSGTGVTQLNDSAQLIVSQIVQNTLTIGSGATLQIAPPHINPVAVPEPDDTSLLMAALSGGSGLRMIFRRGKKVPQPWPVTSVLGG